VSEIIFEALSGATATAELRSAMPPLACLLTDAVNPLVSALLPLDGVFGQFQRLDSTAPALDSFFSDQPNTLRSAMGPFTTYMRGLEILPDIGVLLSSLYFGSAFTTYSEDYTDLHSSTPALTCLLSDATNLLVSQAQPFSQFFSDVPPPAPDVMFLLFEGQGWLTMTVGFQRALLQDTVALTAVPLEQMINTLVERLALSATPLTTLHAVSLLREAVEFVDQLGVIWKLLLQDAVKVGGVPAPSLVAIERVLDSLQLVAGPGSTIEVRNLVAQTLALNDAMAVVAKEQIGDTVAFAEVFTTAMAARSRLLDQILMVAVPSGSARILAVIDETIAIGDTPATTLEALSRLQETVGFNVTLTIGDETYVAWVVNTETRAAWEYANYPFNSFCEFDGRCYGAAADGIYTLGGETDAGTDIKARFRLGLSTLGIAKEKRIPAIYWGVRTNGDVIIKMIVTDETGEKFEHWYRLTARGAAGTREARTQIGRGLESVYWDMEVENVDGADFEFDNIQMLPMILDRRVRGRDE
jgi:hypothetical protein